MIIVVSQAFTKDAGASADAYIEQSRAFLELMKAAPGFRGRKLVRSVDDPTHFTHLRFFESVDAYTALTQHPDYQAQIQKLTEHIDVSKYQGKSPRELMHVILDD